MERQIITRAEAKEQGLKRYFTGKPCKHGHAVERYLSTGQCVECARERRAKNRKYAREYARENPEKIKANNAKRRASTLQRTPKWASQEDTKRVYAWALLAERATGIPHEVDHIIPLRGKNVSGLHVHNNLNPLMYWDHWGKGSAFEVE